MRVALIVSCLILAAGGLAAGVYFLWPRTQDDAPEDFVTPEQFERRHGLPDLDETIRSRRMLTYRRAQLIAVFEPKSFVVEKTGEQKSRLALIGFIDIPTGAAVQSKLALNRLRH